MATSVLVSLIVLISFYGFQVDGKVDRYAFNVVENGTSVNEQIEVDVENNMEVIRVPKHNDAVAVEILNDFNAGLSARRFPASQDCHVSKLDSSVPSPAKTKLDMDQASRQSTLPDKVETTKTGWTVVGLADRSALPAKILDFCGSFPIYNDKEVPLDSVNVTLHRDSGHRRRKRHHWKTAYNPCDDKVDIPAMNNCLKTVGLSKVRLNCKYITSYCFYRATCQHKLATPAAGSFAPSVLSGYVCTRVPKHSNYSGVCCSPVC